MSTYILRSFGKEKKLFLFSLTRLNIGTIEQKKAVEELVNQKIAEALPVTYEDISIDEAKNRGAVGVFGEKYGEVVRVYQIGESDNKFSIEMCGGPHVKNTSELGHFNIQKEEAVSARVRRIKAVLE